MKGLGDLKLFQTFGGRAGAAAVRVIAAFLARAPEPEPCLEAAPELEPPLVPQPQVSEPEPPPVPQPQPDEAAGALELKLAPEPELGPKVAPEPEPEPVDAVERLLGARPGAAWGRLRGRTPQLLSAWQVRPSFSHKSQHTIREGALFGAFLMVRGRRSSASPSTSTMRWHWCAATKPSNLAAHENG